MKVKTKSGFSCDVNENLVKDWRFVKYLALCDSGDESDALKGITKAVPFLLGDKGEVALVEHIAKDGVASTEDMIAEFKEIITAIGNSTAKNSSSLPG